MTRETRYLPWTLRWICLLPTIIPPKYNVLHPHFIWPWLRESVPIQNRQLSTTMPPIRSHPRPIVRPFWGKVHEGLVRFSIWYCECYSVDFVLAMPPLPFGLIMKWSDGTRIEEALAMQIVRDAGLPVPRVICYGEHDDSPRAPASIIMTRVPGVELDHEVWKCWDSGARVRFIKELKVYVQTIRPWQNTNKDFKFGSVAGTSFRSVGIPFHRGGPFKEDAELYDYLLEYANWEELREMYPKADEIQSRIETFRSQKYKVLFTHGDLCWWNVMVMNDGSGRISSWIDWEAAGWYPAYLEFTTASRGWKPGFWWYDIVQEFSEKDYTMEKELDWRIRCLSVDTMSF